MKWYERAIGDVLFILATIGAQFYPTFLGPTIVRKNLAFYPHYEFGILLVKDISPRKAVIIGEKYNIERISDTYHKASGVASFKCPCSMNMNGIVAEFSGWEKDKDKIPWLEV